MKATASSVCEPFASVVVSSIPAGSPLNWYGACCSVHFFAPSIEKSTRTMPKPVAATVHCTEPLMVAPEAIELVSVTLGAGGGGGGGEPEPPLLTVTPEEMRPTSEPDEPYATASSVCEPFASVVVSSLPFGSPLNWYGAYASLHFFVPSIKKSIRATDPEAFTIQATEPPSVAPFAIELVRLTVAGAATGAGAGATTAVGSEVAAPCLLLGVAVTRSLEPTSADTTEYVCAVPLARLTHALPLTSHLVHWYVHDVEPPLHPERSAVSVAPT